MTGIYTTPHIMGGVYPNTPNIINTGLTYLKQALTEAKIDVVVEAAAEYKIDELFTEYLANDNLLTLGRKSLIGPKIIYYWTYSSFPWSAFLKMSFSTPINRFKDHTLALTIESPCLKYEIANRDGLFL